jgi:hypothetical protein
VIEQRTAHFERVEHRGAVDLHQHVVGHVSDGVQVEQRRDLPCRGRGAFVLRARRRVGIMVPEPRRQLGRQQAREIAGREVAHRLEVAIDHRERQAVELAAQTVIRMQEPRRQCRERTQRARHAIERRVALRPRIRDVAAVGLVTPVARERHGHVPARHLGQVVGRDHRGVGERFIHLPHQPRQQLERARPHDQLVVVGAEVLGDAPGVLQLAQFLLLEADAEGLDRLAHRPGHEGRDHARIDAA